MSWIQIPIVVLFLNQVVLVSSLNSVTTLPPPELSVSVNATLEWANGNGTLIPASATEVENSGHTTAVMEPMSGTKAPSQAGNTAHVSANPSQSLVVDVPSSLFNNTAHAANPTSAGQNGGNTAGAVKPSVPGSSVLVTTVLAGETPKAKPEDPCKNVDWEKAVLRSCADEDCVKEQLSSYNKKMKCKQRKPENVTLPEMTEMIQTLGISLAESVKAAREQDNGMNASVIVMLDNVALSAGVIDSKDYNGTKEKFLTIPKDLTTFTGKWSKMTEAVSIPVSELPTSGKSLFVWASVDDFAKDRNLESTEMDWDDNIIAKSEISELYVEGDKLLSRKKVPDMTVNSRTIMFSLKKWDSSFMKGPFKEPVKITFRHKKEGSGFFDPACTSRHKTKWSRDGLEVGKTNSTHTVCELKHFSTFGVIMKVTEKIDYSDRELVVTLAGVLGSISLLCLLLCSIIIIGVGYHHVDQMRIALNLAVALILSHLVFFIGLSTKANMFFTSMDTCKVIVPFQHLFEVAALSWLLMEGLHYYSTLRPLFNEDNTVPIAFYFALGWGIPVAVASACADFPYPHLGSPETSEFCWMFIRGADAWYFCAPVLLLVLLNLFVRACVLKEVITWKGDPDDLKIERAKARLKSFLALIVAISLAWLFGVLAVNNSGKKAFHYAFLVFFMLQGLVVFVSYSVKNEELIQYHKGKKEEKEKERTATLTFEYVP